MLIILGKTIGIRFNDLSQSITPSPGSYEFFSDFEGFYKYGKKNNDEGEKDYEDQNVDDYDIGEKSKAGSSDTDEGNSSANGNNLKEVFGKDVDENIQKVKIKKPNIKN